MGVVFYNIFLFFFKLGAWLSSPFSAKARQWVAGRRGILSRLQQAIQPGTPVIWMHCASLGEFEQGRPLLERIRAEYPNYRILLTFFSPSGYEVRKNYEGADWVFYLPMDGARTARRFLDIVSPALVIFVKYEFWYYYLKKIKYRTIPLLLVSALFREKMSFFKWYGGIQRKILSRFDHLFVQDQHSMDLLKKIGLERIGSISGDTRFDRVIEIASRFEPIPLADEFASGRTCLVAGSTWPEDEDLLKDTFALLPDNFVLLLAPHEITAHRLQEIDSKFSGAMRFSTATPASVAQARYLVIDNIGMLSKLYHYGKFAFVGGGMRTMGVHNVLEAAVYGRTVFFGPYFEKYQEAAGLVASGGAIPVKTGKELARHLGHLLADKLEEQRRAAASLEFVKTGAGATGKILRFIQENRLLTS